MTSGKIFNKIQRSVGKKGSENTEELSKALMEELNCETAFTIPVFGGIPVAESVVVTWVIMAVLLVAAFFLGRNLRVENVGKRQLAVETVVGGLHNFFYDLLGEEGKCYIPYLMTVGVYIAIANMIGLFGLKSPTKDVGVTGALALMSIVLIEYSGVRAKGMKGFLKSFAEPIPIMLPMNILEIFIRPLSLCMRLFGNILGAFVIMELIKLVVLAFYKCFLYNSEGWIDEEKFKMASVPLVKMLGAYFVPDYATEYAKFASSFVIPTVVQLVVCTSGHDDWWIGFNHEVLIQTRSPVKEV